jgi:hypothetical protein
MMTGKRDALRPFRSHHTGMVIPDKLENMLRQRCIALTKDEGFISGKKDGYNDTQLFGFEKPVDEHYILKKVDEKTYKLIDRGTV